MTVPRRSLSKVEHLRMFLAQDQQCNCGQCGGLRLIPGEIHEQHDPPYNIMKDQPGYDGKPDKLFTKECHENITRTEDLPTIVKARHQAGGKGSQIARRGNKSYKPIPSRGFNKSLTKGFDGKVRKREKPA